MARKNRSARIADEVRRIVAQTLQTEIRDPRIPFLTSVTEVRMSGDLSVATILCSIPGDETAKTAALQTLDKSKGLFRSAVARGLSLRTAPELVFALDRSLDEGSLIDAKLREIQQEREAREARQAQAAETAEDSDDTDDETRNDGD